MRWTLRLFFFSSRRRHTRYWRDWSSDVCSSDLESPILDDRRHLARYPEPAPLLLHRHRPVRLLDRLDDGVLIERPYGAQIYDLRAHAVLLGQGVGGPQTEVYLPTVGDERNVRALARDARLPEGDGVVSLFDFALRPVERASLEEN